MLDMSDAAKKRAIVGVVVLVMLAIAVAVTQCESKKAGQTPQDQSKGNQPVVSDIEGPSDMPIMVPSDSGNGTNDGKGLSGESKDSASTKKDSTGADIQTESVPGSSVSIRERDSGTDEPSRNGSSDSGQKEGNRDSGDSRGGNGVTGSSGRGSSSGSHQNQNKGGSGARSGQENGSSGSDDIASNDSNSAESWDSSEALPRIPA